MPELQLIKCVYILRYPAYHLISTCKISTIECDICFALCTHVHTHTNPMQQDAANQTVEKVGFLYICSLQIKLKKEYFLYSILYVWLLVAMLLFIWNSTVCCVCLFLLHYNDCVKDGVITFPPPIFPTPLIITK